MSSLPIDNNVRYEYHYPKKQIIVDIFAWGILALGTIILLGGILMATRGQLGCHAGTALSSLGNPPKGLLLGISGGVLLLGVAAKIYAQSYKNQHFKTPPEGFDSAGWKNGLTQKILSIGNCNYPDRVYTTFEYTASRTESGKKYQMFAMLTKIQNTITIHQYTDSSSLQRATQDYKHYTLLNEDDQS